MKNYFPHYKKLIPHLIAIVIFILISAFYFSPVLEGKVLNMSDILQHKGMAQEAKEYKMANDGEQTLWTGTSFSGMPLYQTGMRSKTNLITYVDKFIKMGLPRPLDLSLIHI